MQRFLIVLVALLVAGLSLPGVAAAHAVFISSTPAPGAQLAEPPQQVRIVFSEPLNAPLSGIQLYSASGARVTPRSGGVDPSDSRAYHISLPKLAAGHYSVAWHTVSLVDGHFRQGSYTFTVLLPGGKEPPGGFAKIPVSSTINVPTWANAAAKGISFLGAVLVAGVVLLSLLSEKTDGPVVSALPRRAMMLTGLTVLAIGSAGQLVEVWLPAGRLSAAGSVLGGQFGEWLVVRAAAIVLLFLAANWIVGADGSKRAGIAGAFLTFVVVLSFSGSSHGASSAVPAWGLFFDAVHLTSVLCWLGGLIMLSGLLLRWRLSSSGDTTSRLLTRFSNLAGVAVPAVLASGVGSVAIEVGGLQQFTGTGYGRTLLVKIGLALVLLAIAGLNAAFLRRRFLAGELRTRWLRRTVVAEALVGVAILAPAALLSVQVPARSAAASSRALQQVAANTDPSSQFAGNTTVGGRGAEMFLTPAAIGVNVVRIELDGLVHFPHVQLLLNRPGGAHFVVTAIRSGTDHDPSTHTIFTGHVTLAGAAGTWQAAVILPGGAQSIPLGVSIKMASSLATTGLTAPPTGWLVVILLCLFAATGPALARGFTGRRTRFTLSGVGGASLMAAAILAVTLGSATSSPAGVGVGGEAATPTGSSWGKVTTVPVHVRADGVRIWRLPSPVRGFMTPAIGPDGAVWVGEMDTNALARLEPDSNTLRELSFGSVQHNYQSTMGLVVTPDGDVWIAQEEVSTLARFDPRTGAYKAFVTPTSGSSPTGVAVDASGNIWLTELGSNKLARFDPRTNRFKEYSLPGKNGSPYWVAVAPNGRVWYTDLGGGEVGVLDPSTAAVHVYSMPDRQSPTGIAVDPHGNVWVGTNQGSLIEIQPSATPVRVTVVNEVHSPVYGIAIGPHGGLWFGTTGTQVFNYSPATHALQAYDFGPNSGPWWPYIGPSGHIWVVLSSPGGNGIAELP